LRETLHIAFKKCMCQIEAFKHTLGRGKFIYKSKHTFDDITMPFYMPSRHEVTLSALQSGDTL